MILTKVLFVTADLETINGLQKLQLDCDESLEFFFTKSKDEVIKIISEKNIAIIVTDSRISKINKSELLNIIKENFPKTFRICLLSDTQKIKEIHLLKNVHRTVKLPLDYSSLLKTLNELNKLIKHNIDALLIEKINGLGTIPILPDIYLRLEKEICMSTFSMYRLAEIIQADPLMVARILHIAHSSFFNIPTGVTNLLQALNFLGVNIVKTLVLYVKIFALKNVCPETQSVLRNIRTHSINVAKLSRTMMEKETSDKNMIELAYISGLLHDVGKIALLQLNDKNKQLAYSQNIKTTNSVETEEKLFDVTHITVGTYILRLWNFQEEIVDAVASHHDSGVLENRVLTSKEIVFIANAFSHKFEDISEGISNSYGSEKFDQWDQLFKDDIRPALNFSM